MAKRNNSGGLTPAVRRILDAVARLEVRRLIFEAAEKGGQ